MIRILAMMFAAQATVPPAATAAMSGGASWIAQRCAAYGRGYCRLPFQVALNAAGEIGASKLKIQVRGYHVREQEGFALYADVEAARRGWQTDSILIETRE